MLVGDAQRDTANLGQTAAYSYVWGKDAGIAAVEARPSQESLHLASNFEWLKPYVTTKVETDVGLAGIETVLVRHANDLRIVAPDAGFLWKNAVA